MSGTLYVVSTPIGNLEDITLRALRILREVQVIAAEDTRRTAKLLAHHGLGTPTISFHEHNARTRIPQLVLRLEAGAGIALVTDAGTPGISDPGVELVDACIRAGIPIDPIPGPNASLTAAIASGFPLDPLTIYGFPPNRSLARKLWLEQIHSVPHTLTFFEAPHRIRRTLAEAAIILGERPITVARELTKYHQELIRGPASTVAKLISAPRGEYTVVVGPVFESAIGVDLAPADEVLTQEFWYMAKNIAVSRREAIKSLAQKYRLSVKEVYAAIERHRSSGK